MLKHYTPKWLFIRPYGDFVSGLITSPPVLTFKKIQHILWEYDNMGDQRDVQHWDYVNHEWKRPCMPRIDTSY